MSSSVPKLNSGKISIFTVLGNLRLGRYTCLTKISLIDNEL